MLTYPLRAKSWSRKHAHMFCSGLWTLSLCGPLALLVVDMDDVYFSRITYTCRYAFSADVWKYIKPILFMLFVLIPTIGTIVSSVLIITKAKTLARRSEDRLRWQGILTVVLTAAVYCISFLPMTVHLIIQPYVDNERYQTYAPRIVDTLIYFNVVANIFIYSFTVTSFRVFLRTRIKMAVSWTNRHNSKKSGNNGRCRHKEVLFRLNMIRS